MTKVGGYSSIWGQSSQQILEDEVLIRGYQRSSVRTVIYHLVNLVLVGIPTLVGRWNANWKIKLTCYPCPLRYANYVILTEEGGTEEVSEIHNDPVDFLPDEFRVKGGGSVVEGSGLCSNSSPILRYFIYRNEKFVWEDGDESFRKIVGLGGGLNCHQILDNYKGLSHSKRSQMRLIYGVNSILVEVKSYWKLLVDEVLNPFYVFQILSVILWCFDDYIYYATCVVIISAISISISLVETKKQSMMLREMAQSSEHALLTVRRCDGEEEELSARDIVPGDVIVIPPEGFIMPCDAVLINGSCIVNESMLTGESIPVQKSALVPSGDIYDPDTHKRQTLFCGTQIIQTRFYSGHKVMCVVVRTGYNTLKGQLIRSILFPKELGFQFYVDAMKFIMLLFCMATIGMGYCIYLYVSRGAAWYVTMVRVLDIVTIVVPPALPAAMTVGTVYAQSRLRAKQIFCISPPRINFCGKLKLICFDKTGTLTEDGLDLWCVVPAESNRFLDMVLNPTELKLESPLLRSMASCHSLTYINKNIIGDPLDLKMFGSTGWELEEPLTEEADTHKFDLLTPSVVKKGDVEVGIIREFEFTSQLQRMSVVVRSLDSPEMTIYCKGAPEKIRALCNSVPEDFDKVLDSFTVKGYRVLALGHKNLKGIKWHQVQLIQRDSVEKDLIFCGFLVMQNSLKAATIPVINELTSASVRCVMVTGDNMLTALSVARECGIIPPNDKVIIVNVNEEGELKYTSASPSSDETPAPVSPGINNNRRSESKRNKRRGFLGKRSKTETAELILEESLSTSVGISNYHFVMNGRTWSLLPEVASTKELELIVAKGTVYARMSPENKRQLVEELQGIGYVVGMCGDGANDCSALKMAHVGISLSEAEASVAAPFTSKVPDVSCVPTLIREGRCALVTSFAIFKYMALYSMIQFASVLILYSSKTNLADTQFLFIDLGITTTIAIVMGRTQPHDRLVSRTPMGSLVSFRNVFSIISQVLISAAIQLAAMAYLKNQVWYQPVVLTNPDELVSLCWETTTIFSVSCFQYLILAMVFSKGPPFRKPFYTNGYFVLAYIVLIVVTILLVVHPLSFLSTFFYLMPLDSATSSFRWTLLAFPAINIFASYLFETNLTGSVIKGFGRLFIKKKEKCRYKTLLRELEDDISWPPLS